MNNANNNNLLKAYSQDLDIEHSNASISMFKEELIDDRLLYIEELLNTHVKPNTTILDIGCGDGEYHTYLKNYNFFEYSVPLN